MIRPCKCLNGWPHLKIVNVVVFILMFSPLISTTAESQEQSPPQRVSGDVISSLIRSTMIAVNHANQTGNYSVLRDLGASQLKDRQNIADLADIFRGMRQANSDLSSTVLIDPTIVGGAKLTTDGKLGLKGYFPTKPQVITFDLAYIFEKSSWKISTITIGFLPPGQQVAPNQPPSQSQAPRVNGTLQNQGGRELSNLGRPLPLKNPAR